MRRTLNKKTEVDVLIRCRRRCAICFGLNRDASIKKGQIAHLDKDNSNSTIDNLVFLCLEHHDQYDSKTSQSKNLTKAEVQHYRDELETQITNKWKEVVQIKITPLLDLTDISGHYFFESSNATAEFDIKALGNNMIAVTGLALWGNGPNIGQIDFTAKLSDNTVQYRHPNSSYEMNILFALDGLTVTESKLRDQFGLNVSFAGNFTKTVQKKQDQILAGENLTIILQGGNIFIRIGNKDKQLTFCGCDKQPLLIGNRKILYVRQEEGFGHIGPEERGSPRQYYTYKIMTVDIETLSEETVTDRKPYEDGLEGTINILRVINPTLSLDGKYLYFVTEKYATACELVKINLKTGGWTGLFSAESFELITLGHYRGLFLIAKSEIRNRGRDIYYKLCDESGKVFKEFDSEESLMNFKNYLALSQSQL